MQTGALKTFSQAASTFAYAYLKINDEYTKDVELLIPAYNHYVHHLQRKRYEKEKKKKAWESKRRQVIVRTRKQLRDSRVKFASDHKLPQRYRRIVSDINSHSDDEYDPQRDVYVVKKLNYRSANATKFFRRLDKLMLEDDQVNNRKPRRKRLFMKTGPASIFRKAPRGHPLDFYDPIGSTNARPNSGPRMSTLNKPAEDDNDSEEDNGNSEEYIDDLEEDNDDSEEDNDDSEEDNERTL
ncbi:hypothetical protein H4Q26_017746 [Puccinia striiformis f. sp. tritici PST-130]|nr:hypothetical protein H4Q26_017746 [Puccinia striiformis f. sp. tritici PST-130]